MRSLILCLSLLVGSVSHAQNLSEPVDYVTRAKPASMVLAELSKKTGVEMACTPDLDNEPVILRFQHVPLKEAMDKIAYIFAGEWKKRTNGFELARGKEADQLHAAAMKAYEEDFGAGVARVAKDLGLDAPYSAEIARGQIKDWLRATAKPMTDMNLFSGLHKQDPVRRLLVRILAKMDPSQMVARQARCPRVFSNAPTDLQSQLPGGLDPAISEYEKAQGVLDAAIDAVEGQPKEKIDGLHASLSRHSQSPVDRILVTVEGARGRYNAGIFLVDSDGRLIANGGVGINGRADLDANIQEQSKIARTKQVTTPLGPLALDILPNINNIENFRRVGPETKAVVLAPTRTDPLAIATSDVVLGLAEAEHVNAAVLPPDDCEDWCYRVGRSGKVSLAALAQEAAYSKELELAEEKGWLVGAPTDPLETTWERLSRPALEELLNAIESTRTVPIDALARFEMQAGPDSNKVLASTSTMALHNWTFYDLLPNGDLGAEPCLALLGTLNDDQRQRAAQGTLKVDPTQLSKEQVAYLHDWLLAYGQKFMPKAPGVDFAEAWKTLDGRGEPTEVLGSGLPAGSYLELIDRTKLDFTIKRTQDSYGCDLDGLAQLSAKAERPELFPTIVDYHLDSIWAGTERNLVMRFVVGNRSEDQAFSERHSPNRRTPGQTIPEILDQLSPDVRITYTRALEKYRSEFARKKPR